MAGSSVMVPQSASADGAPLLSWPLKPGELCILTSNPDYWAALTAWDIREHDLDRWLEARHGAKPEDFWSQTFIEHRGRNYCEAVLKYIIMFNHEEVGGHAVMFIDQMVMQWPHYFPYAMKYRCNVDDLFEPDQIHHYGRVFLEKVVEWCKLTYEGSQAYWDAILDKPPMDEQYDAFVQHVRDRHKPQKLKDMHIVPPARPDRWPCDYFAEARGKTSVPVVQLMKEKEVETRVSSENFTESREKPLATGSLTDSVNIEHPAGHSISTTMQDHKPSHSAKKPSVIPPNGEGPITSTVEGNTKEGNFDNKHLSLHCSNTPSPPVSKKEVSAKETESPGSSLHRRVKSESDSPDKKSAPSQMSLADWMTAPGKERRAFSTESQSELVANTAKNWPAITTSNHGRGGLHQAGQFKYRQGMTAPVFNHPYDPQTIVMNNAAYLYHEDHNFGRHYPSLPDHSTTYRQGTNIYKTNPRPSGTTYHADSSGADMFVPLQHPHSGRFTPSTPHPNRAGPPNAPRMGQRGQASPQVRGNPFAGLARPSPRMGSAGQHGAYVAHPYPPAIPSVPFGSVPPTIMVPYVEMAHAGQWPHVPVPLSQVGAAPLYPGIPRALRPSYSRTGHPNPGFGPRNMSMASPQPGIEQQIQAVRQASGSSTPCMGLWEGRAPSLASEHMQSLHSSNENRPVTHGHPGGMIPGHYPNMAPGYVTGSLHHTPEASRRMLSSGHHGRRNEHSSDSTAPFPSYHDEAFDPSSLPEREQCTIRSIGPDAEDVVTLWFANISPNATVEQLRAFIEKKMPVDHIRSPFTPAQGSDLGWTFVRFVSNSDTRIALEYFAGREFNGIPLKVQVPDKRAKDGRRGSRGGSFNHRYAQPQQQPTFVGPIAGHQTSFNGGGTPIRFQNMGNMSGPRSSRAGSMSQAINAVHRNRAFSKQDARSSELPAGDVSEAVDYAVQSTPAPSIPEVNLEQASASPKKVSKSKKKKKKPAKSRDASVTPSDSNLSSVTEGFPTSRDNGNTHKSQKDATIPRLSYSAALNAHVDASDTPVVSTDEDLAVSKPQPDDVLPTTNEEVVSTNEDQPGTRAEPEILCENAEESTIEFENNEQQEEPLTADLGTGSPAPVEQEFQLESQAAADDTLDAGEVVEVQSAAAASSVAEQKDQSEVDHQHEQKDESAQKEQPAVKVAKQKGAAQTESFSIFATKNKSGKAAQKKKAKQAKQAAASAAAAARKASKQSSDSAETIKADANSNDEQLHKMATASDDNVVADDAENTEELPTVSKQTADDKERSVSQHLRSESSSMAGTPRTAREYPTSAPNTPSQKLSFSSPETTPANVASQVKEDDSAKPTIADDCAPEAGPAKKPKKKKPKKKPAKNTDASEQQGERIIGKEADENDSDASGKTSSNTLSTDHTTERWSCGASEPNKYDAIESADMKKKESFRTPLPSSLFEPESTEVGSTSSRKENNKSAMTYAQAAKNNQDTKAAAGGGLGLSERDVNVQR